MRNALPYEKTGQGRFFFALISVKCGELIMVPFPLYRVLLQGEAFRRAHPDSLMLSNGLASSRSSVTASSMALRIGVRINWILLRLAVSDMIHVRSSRDVALAEGTSFPRDPVSRCHSFPI
jgi:hypothetical protein